jgi:hypothetical protein
MSGMRALRAAAALATVGGTLLVAPTAEAGTYALSAHVDGVAGGGNYTPTSFHWSDEREITFSHITDASSVTLLGLAQSHQDVGNAIIQESMQVGTTTTAVVTLQMYGVHIEAVREDGNANNPNGPEETVVLRFHKLVYTYQPVNPTNGKPAGAAVTISIPKGPS